MPGPIKKLIEVALPLEEINAASAREKSIRLGHPSTMHLWFARRPLAAARAIIFAQMVDDPSTYVDELRNDATLLRAANRELKDRLKVWSAKRTLFDKGMANGMQVPDPGPEPTLDDALIEIERDRLFRIIARRVHTGRKLKAGERETRIDGLVAWTGENEELKAAWERDLAMARDEIRKAWARTCRREKLPETTPLPAFHDPFAGGGTLPLEAQRLGLDSYASDLNPVAVLINKVMLEFPPKFAGQPPINPATRNSSDLVRRAWSGANGLAEDVRYYGQWMRAEAEQRVGQFYPKISITAEMAEQRPDLKPLIGRTLTVIAWLWARTVKSPNPAFSDVHVPLASTFMLSTKTGKEAYVEPVIEGQGYRFAVHTGKPEDPTAAKSGTKLGRGSNFRCVMSGTPISGDYIKAEGKAGRMGARLMAIVAEGDRGRIYLPSNTLHEELAAAATPGWRPELTISGTTQYLGVKPYGMDRFDQLFTDRQLTILATLSDLAVEVRNKIRTDLEEGASQGLGLSHQRDEAWSSAYADAVATCLSMCVSRQANRSATLNIWDQGGENVQQVFGMQALRMTWDFVEGNPFSASTGNFSGQIEYFTKVLTVACSANAKGTALQADAQTQKLSEGKLISTDPPYYDNVPYADLSDFFHVWLRRSLGTIFPELFSTLAVPKAEELVAFAYRHKDKSHAEEFFLDGMTEAMRRLVEQANDAFPVTIYYAFRQSETEGDGGVSSTGWETFLTSVIAAGFAISGTWPVRTEYTSHLKTARNALASCIVIVCRPRARNSPVTTRKDFVTSLKKEMPTALRDLQHGNLAPVDLPQSAIGPGMAIFTRYSKIVEADGTAMSVRTALQLINYAIDEFLSAQEAQMDDWTRFAVTWFSQHAYKQGAFGDALNVATARNISVDGVRDAGIIESGAGRVRLYRPSELDSAWDPASDARLTTWEIVHHLVRLLSKEGEAAAAKVLSQVGGLAEDARSLCYRLYTICEQKKWAEEGRDYNALIVAWPELTRLAAEESAPQSTSQAELGLNT